MFAKSKEESKASETVRNLKTGWNLGNTLDAIGADGLVSETSWGQPVTTKAMIDKVAEAGFKTIRIPVSWHNHMKDGVIDPAWLERVKQIVDWAAEDDLYVIINIHHDTYNPSEKEFYGYYPSEEYRDVSVKFVKDVWTQVSELFKNYNEKLIFETMNEPRMIGDKHEWNFNAGCRECKTSMEIINLLNQTALDTIRNSGGQNENRLVLVPSYAAAPASAFSSLFKLPEDRSSMTALSVHMYTPYSFAMESPGERTFTDSHKTEIKSIFTKLSTRYCKKGIPVIIGEYGATNKNNAEQRNRWARYFISNSTKRGMAACLWDNGFYEVTGTDYTEKYGYFNRNTLSWYDSSFIEAIMESCGESE